MAASAVMIAPERAMVFVDAMNLYESLGAAGINTNVDYNKLAMKLVGSQRRLIRCHVYTGAYDQGREPAKYAGQVRFFNRVHLMPFVTLKSRPLLFREGTFIQKGVDTLIATDMVSMAFLNHYDIAFLVSGDGDLAPAVEALKAAGKQIIVASSPRSRSTALGNAADHEVVVDGLFTCRGAIRFGVAHSYPLPPLSRVTSASARISCAVDCTCTPSPTPAAGFRRRRQQESSR